MKNETTQCDQYKKMMEEFSKKQETRTLRQGMGWLFGASGPQVDLEARRKEQLDRAFQECVLSKLERLEAKLEDSAPAQKAPNP